LLSAALLERWPQVCRVKIAVKELPTNRFVCTTKKSMKYIVNWIPLRIRVRSRNTQPHLKVGLGKVVIPKQGVIMPLFLRTTCLHHKPKKNHLCVSAVLGMLGVWIPNPKKIKNLCVSGVIESLAVSRHYKPKTKNQYPWRGFPSKEEFGRMIFQKKSSLGDRTKVARQLLVEVMRGAGTCGAPCILDHHCSSASP